MHGLPARNQDPHFCEELSLEKPTSWSCCRAKHTIVGCDRSARGTSARISYRSQCRSAADSSRWHLGRSMPNGERVSTKQFLSVLEACSPALLLLEPDSDNSWAAATHLETSLRSLQLANFRWVHRSETSLMTAAPLHLRRHDMSRCRE